MASIEPLKSLDDDGLPTPKIGAWGEEKYRHVQLYASLFVKSMRMKWDALVYLDLFAGSGRSQIRGTERIVSASPLLILGMPEAFDKYIFCEEDNNYAEALETQRCRRDFPERKVKIITGNANSTVRQYHCRDAATGKEPEGSRILLSRSISNAELASFQRSEVLSQRFMDFLVLIPSSMDANRNEQNYIQPRKQNVGKFCWQSRLAYPGGTRKKRLVSHSNILSLKSLAVRCRHSVTSTLVYKRRL